MRAFLSFVSATIKIQSWWQWILNSNIGKWPIPPALLIILILALAMRITGIGWDQYNFFHPDERSIYMRAECMYQILSEGPGWESCTEDSAFELTEPGIPGIGTFFDSSKSPLNPHWFPLGTFLIYLLVGIKALVSPIFSMDIRDLAITGRMLSTIADLASVALVYFLGKKLYGYKTGLLAALLVTFAVVHIQHSHYYRPETFSNALTISAFWFMLKVSSENRLRDSVFLGIFVGLALATKASMAPIALPAIAVYGYLIWVMISSRAPGNGLSQPALQSSRPPKQPPENTVRFDQIVYRILVSSAAAMTAYLLVSPYSVISFPEFISWNLRELDIVRNAGLVPYTLQYTNSPKLLYELQQTLTWGLGFPLGFLAWGGFLATIIMNFKRPKLGHILILLWALPLCITVTMAEVKFLRYTFPLMPLFIIMGVGNSLLAIGWLKKRSSVLAKTAMLGLAFVIIATIAYSVAFQSIYRQPHTAVQASNWINANVPGSSFILMDNHWDEGLPSLGNYRLKQIPIFEQDTARKISSLAENLSIADYIVFYSNRTYGAISRSPKRYPFSSNYYQLLFGGALGYSLEQSFTAYPRIMGLSLVDDPFTRSKIPVPEHVLSARTDSANINLGYADNDHVTYDHPMVLIFKNSERLKKELLVQKILSADFPREPDSGLFLTDNELEAHRGGATWSSTFESKSFPNRFSILVWLLLIEVAAFVVLPLSYLLFKAFHDKGYLFTKALGLLLLPYLTWLLVSLKLVEFNRLAILTALVLLILLNSVIFHFNHRAVLGFVREKWRLLAFQESVFLVAFFVFIALRLANPDLWHPFRGGEKPMDFAFINAIVRSSTMPPYDPWFAGGYLNYYYFGQFIIGTFIKASGILPETAVNLAIPTLFAASISAAFCLVYNLSSKMTDSRSPIAIPFSPIWAGLFASFFVGVAGNLGGAMQLLKSLIAWLKTGASFPPFDYWSPSRMIPDQIAITEFPFWSFLFADPHAHMIAIPFTLLCIGLAFSTLVGSISFKAAWWQQAAYLTLIGIVVGSLFAINSWDYPTYLSLVALTVIIAYFLYHQRVCLDFIKGAFWRVALILLTSYLAFHPFHSRFVVFNGGIHLSDFQTDTIHYLGINGLFLFLIASYLLFEIYSLSALSSVRPVTRLRKSLLLAMTVTLITTIAYMSMVGYGTVALLFSLSLLSLLLLVRRLATADDSQHYHVFLLLLILGGLGLGIAVDLITANNDIDRMNTIFKLYLQSWVLYAIASAGLLWYLTASLLRFRFYGRWLFSFWIATFCLLLISVSIFPLLGTKARLSDRFSTDFTGLDGAAFMTQAVYLDDDNPLPLADDWEAIKWLRKTAPNYQVIAEGTTEPHLYRWGGRFSIYTGLPSIIGWSWHQTQQRGGGERRIQQRLSDVKSLYSTTNESIAADILHMYDVDYLVIGDLERLYYPQSGLAKFESMDKYGVSKIYVNNSVSIYQISTSDAV
jgi:YYY domain-containing protein